MKMRAVAGNLFRFPGRAGFVILAGLLVAGCGDLTDRFSGDSGEPSSLRLADRAADQGDYETAATLYRNEFTENPDSVDALVGLGRSYRNLGQTNRGEQALREAVSRRGGDPRVLLELGRTQLGSGRAEEALETLQRAQALEPRDLRIITARGIALDRLSRHEEAQDVYSDGLRIDPTDFALLGNLALSRGLSGDPEAGIRTMRELVRDSEADGRTRGNLALLYGLAGRKNEARATLAADLGDAEIEENIAYYRELRELLEAGRPIGEAAAGSA